MPDPYVPALGRISGALLKDNLERNGVDLTFRNGPSDDDILYLDVNNSRIGINNDGSAFDLQIGVFPSGEINSLNFVATSNAVISNFDLSLNIISTTTGPINVKPSGPNPTAVFDKFGTTDVFFDGNTIQSVLNQNIEFDTSGTGSINLTANTNVIGDLDVNGNIGLSGNLSTTSNIIIGDNPLDVVIIQTDFTQDINPGLNIQYDLGSVSKRWRSAHIDDWTKITNIRPDRTVVSEQMLIDGVINTVTTTQSNEDLLINPNTGISYIEQIKIEGNIFTNLIETAGLDATAISNGINLAAIGDPGGAIWNTSVTGFTVSISGTGLTTLNNRTAKLGDIVNDLNNFDVINTDDVNAAFDIGSQISGRPLNEEVWYHKAIKPFIFANSLLYSQYGNGNDISNTPITFSSTGTGYYKFTGDNGFVVPVGTTAERPYAEIGETRWNTDSQLLECFDGNIYIVATGPGEVVTNAFMTELAIARVLTFG